MKFTVISNSCRIRIIVTKTKEDIEFVKGAVCAFCGSTELTKVIDFGKVAVAGAFLKKQDIPKEKKHPLTVVFCTNCFVVQVKDHIEPSELFETDFYFSSAIKTLRDHFTSYAEDITERFLPKPKDGVVVEFGSNDGVLLRPLAAQGIGTVIGVEPAKNIVASINQEGFKVINDFFTVPIAQSIVADNGAADVVMANNAYAHITDINGTTEAVKAVLGSDGVFVFEVHYLGKIIEELQYDFIYHEHIYYYSLLALQSHFERHDMVIFDLQPINIHGGSIRFYATKKGSKYTEDISPAVTKLHEHEIKLGYDKPQTYQKFSDKIENDKDELMKLLSKLKGEGKTIVGYGASGRANTIIQYCGIDQEQLDFIIDDAPAKHGMYTPGSHLLIKDSTALQVDKPDYVLVFAWAFLKEIASKNEAYLSGGGKMIVPLPKVKVITSLTEVKTT